MIVTFGPLIFSSIAAMEAGALATVQGKRNGEAASGDSTAICLSSSTSGLAPAEPVPRRMPVSSSFPAIVQPASARQRVTATTANWLARSRRRAFAFGISGSVVKVAIRAAYAAPLRSPPSETGTSTMPLSPAARRAAVVSRSLPRGVTAAAPVMKISLTAFPQAFPNATTVEFPPKAKEFDRATRTSTSRATFGTTSRSHSGSGST